MTNLQNKKILITGASRGIGLEIAKYFGSLNSSLILVGRNEDKLNSAANLCKDHGANDVKVHSLDLSKNSSLEDFSKEILSDGGIDVLVNNAGFFVQGNALEGDTSTWEQALNLNLLAPMKLTHAFAPGMKERQFGMIINLGSVAGIEGMSGVGVYAATKHGIRGWSRSCYLQLREFGIKVVLINPAFVDTDMTSGVKNADRSKMLGPGDIVEAVKLAVNTSQACCPEEINLKLTHSVF